MPWVTTTKPSRPRKEGGSVLKALGYIKRQPFKWNLFYWLHEIVSVKVLEGLLGSKYAEVAFALHAKAAADEMRTLAEEFRVLVDQTKVATPNIDRLRPRFD